MTPHAILTVIFAAIFQVCLGVSTPLMTENKSISPGSGDESLKKIELCLDLEGSS